MTDKKITWNGHEATVEAVCQMAESITGYNAEFKQVRLVAVK